MIDPGYSVDLFWTRPHHARRAKAFHQVDKALRLDLSDAETRLGMTMPEFQLPHRTHNEFPTDDNRRPVASVQNVKPLNGLSDSPDAKVLSDLTIRAVEDTFWLQATQQGQAVTLTQWPQDFSKTFSRLVPVDKRHACDPELLGRCERCWVEYDVEHESRSPEILEARVRELWDRTFPGRMCHLFPLTDGAMAISVDDQERLVRAALVIPRGRELAFEMHADLPILALELLKLVRLRIRVAHDATGLHDLSEAVQHLVEQKSELVFTTLESQRDAIGRINRRCDELQRDILKLKEFDVTRATITNNLTQTLSTVFYSPAMPGFEAKLVAPSARSLQVQTAAALGYGETALSAAKNQWEYLKSVMELSKARRDDWLATLLGILAALQTMSVVELIARKPTGLIGDGIYYEAWPVLIRLVVAGLIGVGVWGLFARQNKRSTVRNHLTADNAQQTDRQ